MIRDLQQKHVRILDKINKFKDLTFKCDSQSDKSKMDNLMQLSDEIIKLVISHARTEDTELFPLLKKYGLDL